MAQFSINIGAKENQAPDVIGNLSITLEYQEDYIFNTNDFTSNTLPQYHHPQGYSASTLKVLTLPVEGDLQLNGVSVSANDEIPFTSITSGDLVYFSNDSVTSEYTDEFTFTLADSVSNLFSADSGIVTITRLESPNKPPSEVGDGEATIDYGETLVFTRAMFTSATTPPYSDPEGDAALNLRIDSLPVDGNIRLNGVNVTVNQIIAFEDIDDGLLTYVPDLADTDGDIENFTFSIADSGSGQFVS